MLTSNLLRTACWIRVAFVGLAVTLVGCDESNTVFVEEPSPILWQERDDFAQMNAYYLDAKVWIDSQSGQYIDLQFQCFRYFGAQLPVETNLIVESQSDDAISGAWSRYLDAVLFKPEGESARIYRRGYEGEVLSNFQNATLDLGQVLSLDSDENYQSVQLRFVYGASPIMAQMADLGALSRAQSVDFELSANGPETGQFLRACAPVANSIPPK